MLRDASGFPFCDTGLSNHIQKRSLSMIHMSHDGNHRRSSDPFFRVFLFDLQKCVFLKSSSFKLEIEFRGNQNRSIKIDDLIEGCHHPQAHQFHDNFAGFDPHALGKFGKCDGVIHFNPSFDRLGRGQLGFLQNRELFAFTAFSAGFTVPQRVGIKIGPFNDFFFPKGNLLFNQFFIDNLFLGFFTDLLFLFVLVLDDDFFGLFNNWKHFGNNLGEFIRFEFRPSGDRQILFMMSDGFRCFGQIRNRRLKNRRRQLDDFGRHILFEFLFLFSGLFHSGFQREGRGFNHRHFGVTR